MPRFILLWVIALLPACAPAPRAILDAPAPDDRWSRERGRYNRVYSDPNQTTHVNHPSQFMMDCLKSMQRPHRGRAVDLGAGEGRNTFALAQAGFTVSAIDVSNQGLAHIRRRADELHLKVDTVEADVYSVTFEPASINLAVAIFFNVPDDLAQTLHAAIAPGGVIIAEGYPGQVDRSLLEQEFAGWDILRSETVDVLPDWFWGRDKKEVPVARFFARKPARAP